MSRDEAYARRRAFELATDAVAKIHAAKPNRVACFVCERTAELFQTAPPRVRANADDTKFTHAATPLEIVRIASMLATEGDAATAVVAARALMVRRVPFVVVVLVDNDGADAMQTIGIEEVSAT